jgi:hypothetical protein
MTTWSRSCATAVVVSADGLARWPSSGEPMAEVRMERLHAVTVTLDDTATHPDEMVQILARSLAHFDVRITREPPNRCVLVLMVETPDLWLAVLLAMNAMTATGYPPIALNARPAGPDRVERGG